MKDQVHTIKKLISEDKIEQAFLQINEKQLFGQGNTQWEIIQNNFATLKQQKRSMTITDEEYSAGKNKILINLLELLSQLESEQSNTLEPTGQPRWKKLSAWSILILSVLLLSVFLTFIYTYKRHDLPIKESSFAIYIPYFDDLTDLRIEKRIKNRIINFGWEKGYKITFLERSDVGNNKPSVWEAKEIATEMGVPLMMWGQAFSSLSGESLCEINIPYQSLLIDSMRSNLQSSYHNLKVENEIWSGKITGEIEEVIQKTIFLLGIQFAVREGEDPATYTLAQLDNCQICNDVFYLSLRANSYLLIEDSIKALNTYKIILQLDSTNAVALNNAGKILYDQDSITKAIKYIVKANEFTDNSPASESIWWNYMFLLEKHYDEFPDTLLLKLRTVVVGQKDKKDYGQKNININPYVDRKVEVPKELLKIYQVPTLKVDRVSQLRRSSLQLNPKRKDRRLMAFLVGIDNYPTFPPLSYAVRDAMIFEKFLRNNINPEFGKLEVMFISNNEATKRNIINGFEDFFGNRLPGDVCLFYFSGHATRVITPPELFAWEGDNHLEAILTYGDRAHVGTILAPDSLMSDNMITDREISELISRVFGTDGPGESVNLTLIIDSSHSGGFADNSSHARHFQLSACSSNEAALDGIFMPNLLHILKEKDSLSYAGLLAEIRLSIRTRLGGSGSPTPELHTPLKLRNELFLDGALF